MSGLYIKYLFVLQDYVKYLDERNGHIMIHNHKSKIANEQTSSIIYWEQKKISFWKKKKNDVGKAITNGRHGRRVYNTITSFSALHFLSSPHVSPSRYFLSSQLNKFFELFLP